MGFFDKIFKPKPTPEEIAKEADKLVDAPAPVAPPPAPELVVTTSVNQPPPTPVPAPSKITWERKKIERPSADERKALHAVLDGVEGGGPVISLIFRATQNNPSAGEGFKTALARLMAAHDAGAAKEEAKAVREEIL